MIISTGNYKLYFKNYKSAFKSFVKDYQFFVDGQLYQLNINEFESFIIYAINLNKFLPDDLDEIIQIINDNFEYIYMNNDNKYFICIIVNILIQLHDKKIYIKVKDIVKNYLNDIKCKNSYYYFFYYFVNYFITIEKKVNQLEKDENSFFTIYDIIFDHNNN